jgi:proteic killer suppression protein
VLSVTYKSNHLSRICTDYSVAKREYGDRMAFLIHQRIEQLQAANSVEVLVQFSIGRCHPLLGNRKGEYVMDLVHPFRLVFENNEVTINVVRIIKIENYH